MSPFSSTSCLPRDISISLYRTEDGVLISFADMTNVSYDATRDTINLQPGVRWGEAIGYLEPFGVAPLGGRLGY